MVCRTRLILEQTGLTCCCRSQELLSLLWDGERKEKGVWGGGSWVRRLAGQKLARLTGPNKPFSPSITRQQLAWLQGMHCDGCATTVHQSLVSYRRPGQGTPTVNYLQPVNIDITTNGIPLDGQDTPSTRPRRSWSSTQDHSLHSQPKRASKRPPPLLPPRDHSADQPLLYAARSHV